MNLHGPHPTTPLIGGQNQAEKMEPITINEQLLEQISTVVKTEDRAGLLQFVADALNTYIHLGQLSEQGVTFFASAKDQDAATPIKFPFSLNA